MRKYSHTGKEPNDGSFLRLVILIMLIAGRSVGAVRYYYTTTSPIPTRNALKGEVSKCFVEITGEKTTKYDAEIYSKAEDVGKVRMIFQDEQVTSCQPRQFKGGIIEVNKKNETSEYMNGYVDIRARKLGETIKYYVNCKGKIYRNQAKVNGQTEQLKVKQIKGCHKDSWIKVMMGNVELKWVDP